MPKVRDMSNGGSDRIGEMAKWWLRANYSQDTDYQNMRVAMCDCEHASVTYDIAYTRAHEIHCRYCSKVMKTTPLPVCREGKWIDPNSGKPYTVVMRDTTETEGDQSSPAPSQIPRW